MYLLDTNMVQFLLNNDPHVSERYRLVETQTFVSGVVVEEIIVRGYLAQINTIRSGRSQADLGRAYDGLHKGIDALARFRKLPYTQEAEAIFKSLKSGKGSAKVKGMDGRIAAHALFLGMVLVTQNERDFAGVPDLTVEDWAQ